MKVVRNEYKNRDDVSFDDINDLVKHFEHVIERFFKDQSVEAYPDNGCGGHAHVWISGHHDSRYDWNAIVETLVIEPNGSDGASQWEVAVRFPKLKGLDTTGFRSDDYPGYIASTAGLRCHNIDH